MAHGHIRRWAAALLVAPLPLLGLAALAPPSEADVLPPAGTPATVGASTLPTWQIDGVAWQQVLIGNTVFVTGNFNTARPPGVAVGGAGSITAKNFFAYDITTGNPVSKYSHYFNAPGYTVMASPDNKKLYVGGDFSSVDSKPRAHLAVLDVATGALLNDFVPSFDNRVRALGIKGNTIYAGGSFTAVNGSARQNLAALDITTGTVLPWAPTTSGESVRAMVVSPDGSRVVIGGQMLAINGAAVPGHGAVDPVSGATLPWPVNATVRTGGRSGGITSLRTDGTYVYGTSWAGGTGSFEGPWVTNPDGTIRWIANCLGDTYDTAAGAGVVYVVGHSHNCETIHSFPDTNPRVRWMRALAMTLAPVGLNDGPNAYNWKHPTIPAPGLLHWFPEVDKGTFTGQDQGAWTAVTNGNYVALGGEFPVVNGSGQQGLTRFAALQTNATTRPPRLTTVPSRTVLPTRALALAGGTIKILQQSAWDEDNERLTYEVWRDEGSAAQKLVSTLTAASNFWTLPDLTFTDTNVPAGSHTYRVKISDGTGNSIWATRSDPVTTNTTNPGYVAAVKAAGGTSLWRLGEASGTAVYDLLGSKDGVAAAGVSRGAAGAVIGDTDTASSFSGTATGYVSTASAGGTTGTAAAPSRFSISAWFKTTSTAGGRLLGYSSTPGSPTDSSDRQFYIDSAGKLRFGMLSGTTPVTLASTTTVNDGQWHQAVGSFGAGGLALYLDGALVARDTTSVTAPQTYSGSWRIGGDAMAATWPARPSSGYLNGQLDEISVYPAELSLASVRAQYAASGRTPPGLPNQPPTAAFSQSTLGRTATFDARSSTDPDGAIASYSWNFGDGTTGTGAQPTHPYAANGSYPTTLTVTDTSGATATITHTVVVTGVFAKDSFNRTVSGGWGSADIGGGWISTAAAAGSAYSVAPGAGTLSAGKGATVYSRLATAAADTDLTLTFVPGTSVAGGPQYFSVYPKGTLTNGYSARIVTATNQVRTLGLTRLVGGAETVLTSVPIGAATIGTSYQLRVQAVGSAPTTLRVKVWPTAGTEPATWTLTATDSTASLATASGIGVRLYASSSTTNAPVNYRFTSLAASLP